MTDDTPPLQSGSELRNAIFNPDGEHDSPNPEAPRRKIPTCLSRRHPNQFQGKPRAQVLER